MNTYQKIAVLLVRLTGAAVLLGSIAGPLYALAIYAMGREAPEFTREDIGGNVTWILVGVIMLFFSVPIGKSFGRGLD
jgi:hypothetical protein